MIYVQGKQLNIHYNKLLNEMNTREQNTNGLHLFSTKNVCASTFRPIKMIKDMFLPPDKVTKEQSSIVVVDLESNLMQVSESMPGRLHFSDVTFDGYPDLMLTLKHANGTSQSVLFLNQPCTALICSVKSLQRRTFTSVRGDVSDEMSISREISQTHDYFEYYRSIFSSYTNTLYAAFFDLLEDSMVDVLLVYKDDSGVIRISAIYNNVDRTSFFLKARMVSD